jgi:hypothetical protein
VVERAVLREAVGAGTEEGEESQIPKDLELLADLVAPVANNRSAGLCPGLWGLPAFFAGRARHESFSPAFLDLPQARRCFSYLSRYVPPLETSRRPLPQPLFFHAFALLPGGGHPSRFFFVSPHSFTSSCEGSLTTCRCCLPFLPSLSPLFSCSSTMPILQPLCFDNDMRCRGAGGYLLPWFRSGRRRKRQTKGQDTRSTAPSAPAPGIWRRGNSYLCAAPECVMRARMSRRLSVTVEP